MNNKKIVINTKEGYYYFNDLIDHTKMYCVTQDVMDEINEAEKAVNFILANVSDDKMIKACPMGIKDEKNGILYYDIISEDLILFPINKIRWTGIGYDPNSL